FDSRLRFVERTPLTIERANGLLVSRGQAKLIEGLASAINENSSPGDPIFSFAQRGTGFYFLTGRRNPTRFIWWRNVGIKSEDRAAAMEMINNRAVKLILLQDSLKDRRVRDAVTSNYDRVKSVADIGIYLRREIKGG
ncbi:MAG TPA: hypothetical protein VFQ92_16465, partial [Blastocatellia bacterium]|nr:hypothetical protein [Blastocatellia bacterium]